MLYSLSTTVLCIIISAAAVVSAVIIMLMLIGFKLFQRMFHIFSKTTVSRINREPEKTKASQNPDAKIAMEEFEKSKKYFFTRPVNGSPFYLNDEDWSVKPEELIIKEENNILYSYFFSADDFVLKNDFAKVCGRGKTIEQTKSHKYCINLHGYGESGLNTTKTAYQFLKRGINVLSPDLAGHGKDKQKYVSMGYKDKLYVKKWIDYILNIDNNAIIFIYGVSMGATTGMMLLGESGLPPNLKCVISDSAFCSVLEEEISQMEKHTKLPKFPFLNISNIFAKIRLGFNPKKASAEEAAKKNENIPVLFFHGGKDSFVTVDRSRRLYEACPSPKELVIYENAGHVQSMLLNFEDYFLKIDEFLMKYV